MATYLISKEEFVTLYKYGRLTVKPNASAGGDDLDVAIEILLNKSDAFEYAQERLFLTTPGEPSEVVEMVSVTGIYPLDGVSKRIFESEFNGKIHFCDPVGVDKIQSFLTEGIGRLKSIEGIKALFGIFGIKEEPEEEIVREVLKGVAFRRQYKYYDVPFDERSPWSMLIAYDRYRNYPNNGATGYFFDMVDAYLYGSVQHEKLLGFDEDIVRKLSIKVSTELDKFRGKDFSEVASAISSREDLKINASIAGVFGSPFLPALFFLVKNQVKKDGDEISPQTLVFLQKVGAEYPDQFPRLLTLVGGFFGYSWIYDRYYEALGLPFATNGQALRELLDAAYVTKEEKAKQEDSPELQPGDKTESGNETEAGGVSVQPEERKNETEQTLEQVEGIDPVEMRSRQEGEEPASTEEGVGGEDPAPGTPVVPDDNTGDPSTGDSGTADHVPPSVSEEKSETCLGDEFYVDVLGEKHYFGEFAMDVYQKSLPRTVKERDNRMQRFREFLDSEESRKELFAIVISGKAFMLSLVKNKIDPAFTDSQWKKFKEAIMKFKNI